MFRKKISIMLSLIMVLQVLFTPIVQATPIVYNDSPPKVELQHRSFTNGFNIKASPCLYPWFKLVNTSEKTLNLSDIEIRYYYTKDNTKKQVFNCDWSTVGSANVKGEFYKVKLPTEKADTSLNITFKEKAGQLKKGQVVEIHARLWDSLWANYNQTNDHSFNPKIDRYNIWNRVVVLYKGNVIWGLEPLGKLDAPQLQLYQKDKEAMLVWDPVRGAEEYVVKRKDSLGQYEELITLKGETTYTDILSQDKTYYYVVQAKTDNILSPESTVSTYYGKPSKPTLEGYSDGNSFRLKWTNGETTTYNVYRSEALDGPFVAIAKEVSGYTYLDKEVRDKSYYYAVTSMNARYESERSNIIKSEENIKKEEYVFVPQQDDDSDGLTNDQELYYGTDINNWDTDGDGISDKEEIDKGTDPLSITPQTIVEKALQTSVGKFELKIEADKNFANAPVVVKESDNAVLNAMKGVVGKPIEITANGFEIYNATMSFGYEEGKLGNIKEEDLRVFYVNPSTKKLEVLESVVDTKSNKVQATTTHFSTYLLGDKNMPIDLTNVDIVFVIDQSGSMSSNDKDHYRIDATQKFVDSIDETHFRLGIVGFEDSAYIKSGLSSNKQALTQALNQLRDYGGCTDIEQGIRTGKNVFENNGSAKVMILLSDGYPTDGDAEAAAHDLKDKAVINTIALGENADHQLMRNIASITNGAYFYINNGGGLTYEDVKYQMDTIYNKLIKQLSFNEIVNQKPEVKEVIKTLPFDDTLLGVDSTPSKEWLIFGNTNLLNGNWMTQQTDLDSKNLPFILTYNSLSDKNSTVGKGFTHTYDSKITYKANNILVQYPTGTVTEFHKDSQGIYRSIHTSDILYKRENEIILRGLGQKEWVYGETGQLQRIVDVTGLTSRIEYKNNKISKVSHSKGDYLEFTYEGELLKSVTDHTNRSVIYEYKDNKLVQTTDCKKNVKRYYYNPSGKMELIINNDGILVSRNEYDRFGRIIRQYDAREHVRYTFYHDNANTRYYIDENGYENKATYNSIWKKTLQRDAYGNEKRNICSYGNNEDKWIDFEKISADSELYQAYLKDIYNGTAKLKVVSIDKMGNNTVNYLDSCGNIIKNVNALGEISTYSYDKWNNLIKKINIDGAITSYIYNDVGKLILKEIDPFGNQKSFQYFNQNEIGADGLLKKITDQNGNSYSYEYNRKSYELITLVDPQGNKITYTYDERGNQLTIILPNGGVTTKFYDEKNNVTKTISPRGAVTNYTYDAYDNKTNEVFGDGNTTNYYYNNLGQLEKITYEDGTTEQYTYTRTGKIETFKNRLGYITTYLYDAEDRKIDEINPLGFETKFKYDANDNVIKTILPNEAVTTCVFDSLGRIVESIDAKGNSIHTIYEVLPQIGSRTIVIDSLGGRKQVDLDFLGRTTKESNDLGHSVEYFYDGNGNKVKVKDSRGYETKYSYDKMDRLITTVDAKGYIQSNEYDSVGNRIKEINSQGTPKEYIYDLENNKIQEKDALGNIIKNEYDILGRKTKEIDALGFCREKIYDKQGRMIKEIDQIGNATNYEYNALGKIIKQTNALGEITQFKYDELNRPIMKTDADNTYVQYEYDKVGNNTMFIDQKGNKTLYTYDLLGLQTSITTPDNKQTFYQYDAKGRCTVTIDAKGNKSEKLYDSLGRVTSTINQLGEQVKTTYDEVGKVISETNGEGYVTKYTYDKLSNLESVTLPDGTITKYTYDELNNLLSQIDSKGNKLTYTYDLLGREVKRLDSLDQVQTISYDERGYKKASKDRNGQTITYTYDPCGRMLTKEAKGDKICFVYDKLGRIVSEERNGEVTSYIYDNRGHVIQITYPDGRIAQCQYDDIGNKIKQVDPMGNIVDYTYDQNNRMSQVTCGNMIATYVYDSNGNRSEIQFSSGAKIRYDFDQANRLVGMHTRLISQEQLQQLAEMGIVDKTITTQGQITIGEASTTSGQISIDKPIQNGEVPTTTEAALKLKQKVEVSNSYTYDRRGLQASKTEDGKSTYYKYDVCGRLLEERTDNQAINYTYDTVGNRVTKILTTTGPQIVSTYEYDNNNRLLAIQTNTGDSTIYEYDANGNVLSEINSMGKIYYTYTPFDEADEIQDVDGKKVKYTYDANGIRSSKKLEYGTHNYYYAFGEYIGEESNGSYIGYIYGTSLLGQFQNGKVYNYFTNGHGDVIYIQDQNNTLVNYYAYDAFGNRTEIIETIYNPMTYVGYYYDQETGDYYLRARYYDPQSGRFTQEDSFRGEYKDPLSLNLYTYAHNNPIAYIDPSGHWKVPLLNQLLKTYVAGMISKVGVSQTLIAENKRNVGTAMHEIAQVHIGKQLSLMGMQVELEKPLPYVKIVLGKIFNLRKEADIVATNFGGLGNTKWLYEVKPLTRSGEKQLKTYMELDPTLRRGPQLETIKDIPIVKDIKMKIIFPSPGNAKYSFYRDGEPEKEFSVVIVQAEIQRERLEEEQRKRELKRQTDPAGYLFDSFFGIGNEDFIPMVPMPPVVPVF